MCTSLSAPQHHSLSLDSQIEPGKTSWKPFNRKKYGNLRGNQQRKDLSYDTGW